jgi:hypothetical protein
MALTFTDRQRWDLAVAKGPRMGVVAITFDASYAAGGYAVTAANLKFDTTIVDIIPSPTSGGFVAVWDRANSKLMAMYGNYDAGDGPLIEVPNDHAALNTEVTECLVIGY